MAHQITVSLTSKPDPWNDDRLREDPDIKAILEFKESSSVQPSWQDISTLRPTAKHYWVLWDSLQTQNGELYRKLDSDDGRSLLFLTDILKELHSSSTSSHYGVMKT